MRFPFLFDPKYKRAARPFGVTIDNAWVEVTDTEFVANYGPWHVRFPLSNIKRVAITGPYLFVKTAGSARLGFTDRGMTFASNGDRGVELHFHEKITGFDRFGAVKHPNLTVTVADVQGLYDRLTA